MSDTEPRLHTPIEGLEWDDTREVNGEYVSTRSDGVYIESMEMGVIGGVLRVFRIALPVSEKKQFRIICCPCCTELLLNDEQAKHTANLIYPFPMRRLS